MTDKQSEFHAWDPLDDIDETVAQITDNRIEARLREPSTVQATALRRSKTEAARRSQTWDGRSGSAGPRSLPEASQGRRPRGQDCSRPCGRHDLRA
ncbi:MAG TPA: hypothetical protein VN969_19355 [Streptosporangiaceae bacterium]|nr:hypothetical protein [Streptosporangiaceae bacterium]